MRVDAMTVEEVKDEKVILILMTTVDLEHLSIQIIEETSRRSDGDEDGQALRLIFADSIEPIIPMRCMIDFERERKRLEK